MALDGSKDMCALKPEEMYSRTYKDNIKPRTKELIEEMKLEHNGTLPPGGALICHNKAAKEVYDAETSEVKAEIIAKIEEQAKVKIKDELDGQERTPEQYLE